jgi:ABC-type polar amino acid transport system ATPase subunit
MIRLEGVNRTIMIRTYRAMVFQQFNLYPHMTALQNITPAPVKLRAGEAGNMKMVQEIPDVIIRLSKESITTVVVTREMRSARQAADRVIFRDTGILVEEAPPEEFFEHPKNERTSAFLSKILR